MDVRGKVALVTGGAHRVGRAIALALAKQRADVIIHYNRSEEKAAETVRELRALNVRAEMVQANLGNPMSIEEMFAQIETYFGRLHVLVNSASAFQAKDILEVTIEDWNYTMAVNLRAPFLCSQLAAHLMLARGEGGCIVNISDIAGQEPWERYPHHSVSKAGLIMLTKVMAKALAPELRVNCVVPGPVMKPDLMPDARWQRLGEVIPMKRTGDSENVAKAVLALIENDFATGAVFNVDGGDSLVGSTDLLY
jgi:NAD(P)-dependent dehydrogenase (short-subunit alcohol dehydrogenase family)